VSESLPASEHQELQELLGVYALDAVDPETAAMVEHHLAECVKCSVEVSQHHEVAGLLANSGGESPAGLWDGIAAQIDGSVPPSWERLAARLEPVDGRSDRLIGSGGAEAEADADAGGEADATVVPITDGRRNRWVLRAVSLVAAAAAVIALVLGAQVHHLNNQVTALQANPLLSAAEQSALRQPSTKQVELTSKSSTSPGKVTVVLTSSGTGFVEVDQLSSLPSDKTYQLWGVIGGKTISLGLLGPHPAVVPFSVAGDGSVQAFAITAEQAGGVVQSANTPVVAGEVTA
jgi:anti-sigma factor RsiW